MTQTFYSLVGKITNSPGLRFTLLTVVGNFLATGLSAVTIILISRLLGPSQFGVFSIGFSIVMILNRINDVGLSATLLKFASNVQDPQKNNALFSFVIKIKLYFSVAIVIVGLLISPLIARQLKFSEPTIIYLAFLLSVFAVWYEQLVTMIQASHRFDKAVLANLYQAAAKLLVIGTLFLLGIKNTIFSFSWYMIAPVVPVLLASKLLPAGIKLNLRQDFSSYRPLVFQMARHSAVGFIAAGFIENIDILFVQRYLSTYEVGLLGGVSRISAMLLLVAYSLGNVLYPRVAQYHELRHLKPYIKKAIIISLLSLFGFVLFIPFSRLSILLTIGPEYVAGNSILLVLAASSFITIATIPFLALFYVFKEEWYFSVSGIGQLLIVVLGNYWFVPTYGLEASAWTRLVCRCFLFAFTVGLAFIAYRRHHARYQSAE